MDNLYITTYCIQCELNDETNVTYYIAVFIEEITLPGLELLCIWVLYQIKHTRQSMFNKLLKRYFNFSNKNNFCYMFLLVF